MNTYLSELSMASNGFSNNFSNAVLTKLAKLHSYEKGDDLSNKLFHVL